MNVPWPPHDARDRTVLYACLELRNPVEVLRQLRRRAMDEGLHVAQASLDRRLATPPRQRPGWRRIARLVEEGAVQHLIAPTETQIAFMTAWQPELHRWLREHNVSAHYLHPHVKPSRPRPGQALPTAPDTVRPPSIPQ